MARKAATAVKAEERVSTMPKLQKANTVAWGLLKAGRWVLIIEIYSMIRLWLDIVALLGLLRFTGYLSTVHGGPSCHGLSTQFPKNPPHKTPRGERGARAIEPAPRPMEPATRRPRLAMWPLRGTGGSRAWPRASSGSSAASCRSHDACRGLGHSCRNRLRHTHGQRLPRHRRRDSGGGALRLASPRPVADRCAQRQTVTVRERVPTRRRQRAASRAHRWRHHKCPRAHGGLLDGNCGFAVHHICTDW